MLKAVIFDLDGTLIDSRADLATAVNRALHELGYAQLPQAQVVSFVGEGAEVLLRRSLAAALGADERAATGSHARAATGSNEHTSLPNRLPEEIPQELVQRALAAWARAYDACLLDETRAYPGIAELLSEVPAPCAVLTNKPGNFSRRILDGLGLASRVRQVLGGDEAARKPDPRGLLALCESLGAAPGEALLVGDSRIDAACARHAGVPLCLVAWGLSPREELLRLAPDHLVESAEELAALLGRLSVVRRA